MLSKSFALLLTTFTSSAFAEFAVFYCTDVNWQGTCHHSPPIVGGVCHNMEGGVEQFNNAISSFGPDEFITCLVFKAFDCPSNPIENWAQINYPGIANLRTIGFDNQISSYRCDYALGGE
ncbi:hypothetical protein BDN72DRAFT_836729 [Pluteus cervinus]|uniref:Uncharacterized protein n=1 Tax=Pluteus cervinus TaxID=181527 RepID=A0ACD3B2I9_9AGAR|nr:hypothetical protein BDN72DRAFT_836729 [Pluteus cervinus]